MKETNTTLSTASQVTLPTFTSCTLYQFEAIFLLPDQLQKIEEMFDLKNFTESNPLYQSWLPLKRASLPTEQQAIETVLASHTPKNVPKRKTKRTSTYPVGPARFNLTSNECQEILQD